MFLDWIRVSHVCASLSQMAYLGCVVTLHYTSAAVTVTVDVPARPVALVVPPNDAFRVDTVAEQADSSTHTLICRPLALITGKGGEQQLLPGHSITVQNIDAPFEITKFVSH